MEVCNEHDTLTVYISLQVYPQISRINIYGDQASCVIDKLPDLRKYCLCKQKRDEG